MMNCIMQRSDNPKLSLNAYIDPLKYFYKYFAYHLLKIVSLLTIMAKIL